jgi:hypothetical protein
MMKAQQGASDKPSTMGNCVLMILPVLLALSDNIEVLKILPVGVLAGFAMLTRPSCRVRQMGWSLLVGSALSFVYVFVAVGVGW